MSLCNLRNLWLTMDAGIYIHIPFCRSRCSYCDFATGMFEQEMAERYVCALIKEISVWSEGNDAASVETIYFGGGTPSLLAPAQIQRILQAVHQRFQVVESAEVTLEINPASMAEAAAAELTKEKLRDFRKLGINRASFGAQTFNDRELKMLGRTHSSGDIDATLQTLREIGFRNINFDLIAGLPGQTLAGWQRNLDRALRLQPKHLSLYLLDLHEGTPLADQIQHGRQPRPDEDLAGEMYALMIEKVCAAGYEHYEISNFCLPGLASRHNTKYWTGEPYYGFGNSAHSFDGASRRWANERDPAKYIELIEQGESPVVEQTALGRDEARSETIFLGLRLMRGINLKNFRARFGNDLRADRDGELSRLTSAGLIEIDDEILKLTRRGALLSNEVFAALA